MATFVEYVKNKFVLFKYEILAALFIVNLLYFLYLMALVWSPARFDLPYYNYPQSPAYWTGVKVGVCGMLIPFLAHARGMLLDSDINNGNTIS